MFTRAFDFVVTNITHKDLKIDRNLCGSKLYMLSPKLHQWFINNLQL